MDWCAHVRTYRVHIITTYADMHIRMLLSYALHTFVELGLIKNRLQRFT